MGGEAPDLESMVGTRDSVGDCLRKDTTRRARQPGVIFDRCLGGSEKCTGAARGPGGWEWEGKEGVGVLIGETGSPGISQQLGSF